MCTLYIQYWTSLQAKSRLYDKEKHWCTFNIGHLYCKNHVSVRKRCIRIDLTGVISLQSKTRFYKREALVYIQYWTYLLSKKRFCKKEKHWNRFNSGYIFTIKISFQKKEKQWNIVNSGHLYSKKNLLWKRKASI